MAVTVACRAATLLRPIIEGDEAQYAAIGELVRDGGRLYADGGVDNKPPGIYWTFAAVFELFGRYAMWAVHLLTIAAIVATAWLLAAIATRIAGRRAGLLAGVFYGVFTAYPKLLATNTEHFMMLPLAAMVLLLLRSRESRHWFAALVASGALVVAACFYKQVAATSGLVIVAGVIGTRAWLARLAAALLGAVLALAAGVLALAETSSLGDAWHWSFERLAGTYGGAGWRGALVYNIGVGLLPFVAASLVLWIALARAAWLRRWRSDDRVVWVWFAVGFATACAGGRFYTHYFLLAVAPLSVLAAIELERWPRMRVATRVLTALPALVFVALGVVYYPMTESFGGPSPDYREPAAWVREHTRPEERIFVYGNYAAIYIAADRLPATRFVGLLRGEERDRGVPALGAWDTGPEVWPALADDFARHPPAYVLDTSTAPYTFEGYPMAAFPALAAIVARDYVPVAIVSGVTIYRHRG